MKRKNQTAKKKKRNTHNEKRTRVTRPRRRRYKPTRTRQRKSAIPNKRRSYTDPRVVRALGLMRREGVSASVAARHEGMKLDTLRRLAGRVLYRSGPGKPWKVRSSDQLAVMVTIPLAQGPLSVVAKNLAERRLAGAYLSVLRMFRSAEDGAEAALKAFTGKMVGGHKLITDTKLLIELEEAEQLNVENLYTSFGASS